MLKCPICGAEYDSLVCSCSFDESCNFEAYPTFSAIPAGILSVSYRKAAWYAKQRTIEYCPHCGKRVADDQQSVCTNCGLALQPKDIVAIYGLHFDAYSNSKEPSVHRRLLFYAEDIMRYFEYTNNSDLHYYGVSLGKTAQEYADSFARLAEGSQSMGIHLTDREKQEFRRITADANYLIKKGLNPGMPLTEDGDYKFQSAVMKERISGKLPEWKTVGSVCFDMNYYLCWTQHLLFESAHLSFLKENYAEALKLFLSAHEQGNPYAAARIGIMYHFGYGCDIDYDLALKYFLEGSQCGCPLAKAWVSDYVWTGRLEGPITFGSDFWGEKVTLSGKEAAIRIFSEADSDLRKICDAGDMEALCFRGYNLLMGIGVEQDEEEGVRLLSLALQKGNKYAAVQLAECYYWGLGVDQNYHTAFRLLQNYAHPNAKKAQFLLGKCYYYGDGTDQDFGKAIHHFTIAASLGHGSAKDYLGDCYLYGRGTSVNHPEAKKWYKDAADNHGNANAAYELGQMYSLGLGVAEDKQEGMRYYHLAAQKGVPKAQHRISLAYLSGSYQFEKDYEAARMWMEKAAEQGDAESQTELGRYYIGGWGFDNERLAFEWFMKAAEQNYPPAQYYVGDFYQRGIYVGQNYEEANRWFKQASDGGETKASYLLGLNYLKGHGTNPSPTLALHYFKEAADAGSLSAKLELSKLYIQRQENLQDAYRMLSRELATDDVFMDIGKDFYAEAEYWLSVCLKNGYGCTKDKKLAKEHYKKAINCGYIDTEKRKGLLGFLFD